MYQLAGLLDLSYCTGIIMVIIIIVNDRVLLDSTHFTNKNN